MIAWEKQHYENAFHGYDSNTKISQDRAAQDGAPVQLQVKEEPGDLRDGQAEDQTPSESTAHGAAGYLMARIGTRVGVSAKPKAVAKQGGGPRVLRRDDKGRLLPFKP